MIPIPITSHFGTTEIMIFIISKSLRLILTVKRCDEEGRLVEDTRTSCQKQRSKFCEPQLLDQLRVVPPDCPALYCIGNGSCCSFPFPSKLRKCFCSPCRLQNATSKSIETDQLIRFSPGLYSPLQCSQTVCFCADIHTGEEYPGTRSNDIGSFDCDYAGNVFSILEGNGQLCGQQVWYRTSGNHQYVQIWNLSCSNCAAYLLLKFLGLSEGKRVRDELTKCKFTPEVKFCTHIDSIYQMLYLSFNAPKIGP